MNGELKVGGTVKRQPLLIATYSEIGSYGEPLFSMP